jgi:hypothetical protein
MLEETQAHTFFAVSRITSNRRYASNSRDKKYGSKLRTAGTPTRVKTTETAGTPTIWQQANNSRDPNKSKDDINSRDTNNMGASQQQQ